MILLILVSLCVTTLNCQLAFTWLNQQQFQCAQNIMNYHEAIQHQYMCIFSRTRTCVVDANTQYYNSIYLDNFCGFISLKYFTQCEITWSIYVVPNIHINFLNFSLFELTRYWRCDLEYLRAVTTNKKSTFCGTRLPWVYDASDSFVKLIFFTEQFGFHNYQLEFQYYGAHVPNNQHFVLFMKPSGKSDMHVPNIKQNEFETFHFISGHRLDAVYLAAVNVCSTQQIVCYDGPGTKSPEIHSDQSTYQSSTFQMVCKFSRPNPGCFKAPRLIFHGMRQTIEEFGRTAGSNRCSSYLITIAETAKGTSKYIYSNNVSSTPYCNGYFTGTVYLRIRKVDISFPYMLYEKQSCMYGGVYIFDTSSSLSDLYGDEVLSICTSTANLHINTPKWAFSILGIHYEHYSGENINFKARVMTSSTNTLVLRQNSMDADGQTMNLNVTSAIFLISEVVHVESYLLDLTKILYAHIILNVKPRAIYGIKFSVHAPHNSESCVYSMISLAKQQRNFKVRRYDTIILSHNFHIFKRIESIVINMSACDSHTLPMWSLGIAYIRSSHSYVVSKTTGVATLHPFCLQVVSNDAQGPTWFVVEVSRPETLPHYAIWKVSLRVPDEMQWNVYMEVLTDSHTSSSVYEWDHRNHLSSSVSEWSTSHVYMTIDTGINFFFYYFAHKIIPQLFLITFVRQLDQQLEYDERLKVSNKIPRLDNYTFYDIR